MYKLVYNIINLDLTGQSQVREDKMKSRGMFMVVSSIVLSFLTVTTVIAEDSLRTQAPMTTDLAGSGGMVAIPSVFRIVCPSKKKSGTGFLHKSGNIITAAHVVDGCTPSEIMIVGIKGLHIGANGKSNGITKPVIDADLDLAFFAPMDKISTQALPISINDDHTIGAQVSTWGFPEGYNSLAPLLSSGYIAGIDQVQINKEKRIKRLVINAAFNSGNSGGPLLSIENGMVIGVVVSKVAPLPHEIESALAALKKDNGINSFERTNPDGTKERMSEAQVLEYVIQYLRSQTQLVIGHAVMTSDLKDFLKSNKIEQ
jgi:S1-C subfamily serine protease